MKSDVASVIKDKAISEWGAEVRTSFLLMTH